MTHFPPHAPLVLTVLQQVSTERLQRSVAVFAEATLTITVARQTETEIRALVRNGEGKEYGVTLTQTGAFCSCPDALYRAAICKHATVLALTVLRTPQAAAQEQEPHAQPPYNLKLTRTRS
jgi:uncharacterized Zn finger protein